MMYRSNDGLVSSNDSETVALWESITAEFASEDQRWTAILRERGVKLAHPDDGWVREPGRGQYSGDQTYLTVAYAQFDDGPQAGDLIALGWPWKEYRLVRVTEVETGGILIPTTKYHYEHTGEQIGA